MKYNITLKSEIGAQGPGIYVLDEGKKDGHGKPIRKCITVTDQTKAVEQAQAHLTDVKELLEPAMRAGLLRHVTHYEGEYDDILPESYEAALKITTSAQQMFEQLPAKFRTQHANDPKQFLSWVQDPANASKMKEYGMLKGNDGKKADGTFSGAPSPTDKNANNVVDKTEGTPTPTPVAPTTPPA